jgi:hypothetical protein
MRMHVGDAQGVLFTNTYTLKYETSEPTPDRWIAVGTITLHCGCHLLRVGRGTTEGEAIADLEQRALEASHDHLRSATVDPFDFTALSDPAHIHSSELPL